MIYARHRSHKSRHYLGKSFSFDGYVPGKDCAHVPNPKMAKRFMFKDEPILAVSRE